MKLVCFADAVGEVGMGQADGSFINLTALMGEYSRLHEGVTAIPTEPLSVAFDLAEGVLGWREMIPAAVALMIEQGRLAEFIYAADTPLASPLPRPNRILAIGRNYAQHAKESGAEVFEEPIVFLKASQSVIGPDEAIEIPSWMGRVDFEAELLVVIGRGGKSISPGEAMNHVIGYSIFNDVTAREQQREDQGRKHPWFRSKSVDTFGPLGPWLVTADEVPDPHNLRVSLTVNGETKQDDTTASMVYSIPDLIAFLSKWFRLETGDVIATGTPSGVGAIVPGDVVEARVEGLGVLRNPVMVAPE